jgi:hypothetical protein
MPTVRSSVGDGTNMYPSQCSYCGVAEGSLHEEWCDFIVDDSRGGAWS